MLKRSFLLYDRGLNNEFDMTTLRYIHHDQLSESISCLDGLTSGDIVLMIESRSEFTRVKHHKKKIAFWISAMRHFADSLRKKGHEVLYHSLDHAQSADAFLPEISRIVQDKNMSEVVFTEPSDYLTLQKILSWKADVSVTVTMRPDNRFLCSQDEFKTWAGSKKQLRMEFFYREMRKRHAILMDKDQPIGGQWNFDSENRKPPKSGLTIPAPFSQPVDDISEQACRVANAEFPDHFGSVAPFYFAVTRAQALVALSSFIKQRLENFGHYQDAMIENEPWMYHSHISFYLNTGLLLPLECIRAAEHAYEHSGAPLNAVEGFIRQILGWREFVRGIYWLKMPDYAEENFLEAKRDLPAFYWTGATKMNCLKQCVTETHDHAYAHHIQRLMVLGNFALIAGLHPDAVNEWYHIVYADAYQWVELPNVTGMILFADGGFLGSKPYAASGAYINKMSDYCKNCHYNVKDKEGETACPFNYLYWDFLERNYDKLHKNQRMSMIYSTLRRMSPEKRKQIADDSQRFLEQLSMGDFD